MQWDGISPEAMAAWQALEQSWGRPLSPTSGYRSAGYNAQVGGAKGSQHIHGNAFDVDVSGMSEAERVDLIRTARAAGFRGVGVYNGSLHFDVGTERAWGPDYHRGSLPAWAAPALGGPAGAPPAVTAQAPGDAPQQNALAGMQPQQPQSPQNVLAAMGWKNPTPDVAMFLRPTRNALGAI